MNRDPIPPLPAEIESLLANERDLVPETDEVRARSQKRAQAALARYQREGAPSSRRIIGSRRIWAISAAAATLMLAALSTAAIHVGFFTKPNIVVPPNMAPVPKEPPVSKLSQPREPVAAPVAPMAPAKPKAPPPTRVATATYAIELRLLQPAQAAFARHAYPTALASLDEHQRRFPSGQLAEEREALRVKVLLGLGRTADAQRAGAAFRERFPKSLLLRRIEGMLKSSP